MEKQSNINREVDKTLGALDDMKRAKTDAFFYSRLQAKLDNREESYSLLNSSKSYGFTFSVAAVILMIVINISTIFFYENLFTTSENATPDDFANELTADYQVYNLSYYNNIEGE